MADLQVVRWDLAQRPVDAQPALVSHGGEINDAIVAAQA
jgi:hypothetical protein